jgi:hypothetical protein
MPFWEFNKDMAHCQSCNSLVTKIDASCYVCGEKVPNYRPVAKRKPISALSNVIFIASLGFSGYCFFSDHKLSLTVSLCISAALLLLRVIADHSPGQEAPDKVRG